MKYVVSHCNSLHLTADNQSNVSTPLQRYATIEWIDSHNHCHSIPDSTTSHPTSTRPPTTLIHRAEF